MEAQLHYVLTQYEQLQKQLALYMRPGGQPMAGLADHAAVVNGGHAMLGRLAHGQLDLSDLQAMVCVCAQC